MDHFLDVPQDNDIHVIPTFSGEPEHSAKEDCWCEPELDYQDPETRIRVYVHRRPQ